MDRLPKVYHISELIVSAHQEAEARVRKAYVADFPKCKRCVNRTANRGGLCKRCLDLADVFVK